MLIPKKFASKTQCFSVFHRLTPICLFCPLEDFWIGANDIAVENTYTWIGWGSQIEIRFVQFVSPVICKHILYLIATATIMRQLERRSYLKELD